ncbi:hypothetical protein GW846_04755 [Candidatus Gracilibacteria bacterium]|nr:hypothetical protein [Candidatus Gracilibacteria bacterium]
MKQVSLIIILTVFLTGASSDSLNAAEISKKENNQFTISSSTHSEAQLLQSYVSKYKTNINKLYNQVQTQESEVMIRANEKLFLMISQLYEIKNGEYSEEESNKIMNTIVSDIRVLNTRLKGYIEQEQIEQQIIVTQKQKKYSLVANRIAKILDSMIEKLSAPLVNKNDLTNSDITLVSSLIKIQNENNKIKSFSKKSFLHQEEMQFYFQSIIKNIRNEIKILKNTL